MRVILKQKKILILLHGNYRTTDLNYSVAKVGTVLDESLTSKGFHVIHNLDYHDYPAYNGSYSRSFNTVSNLLANNPGIQLVIDLHRDAIGSMNQYAPSVKIGDEIVSQLMFVIRNQWRRIRSSKLENKFKICYKNSRKSK